MLHVFDFSGLRGATPDSHVKVIKDGEEQSVFGITTDEDGDVLIILTNDSKGVRLMYYSDADERDALLLARDPATIKDPDMLKRYYELREEQDE